METREFLIHCERWLNDRLIEAAPDMSVSRVMTQLGTAFAHFIVVRAPGARPQAVLATIDFLNWLQQMKLSRFPGDVDPSELSLERCLPRLPSARFTEIDADQARGVPARWLSQEPSHVLITQDQRLLGVIPRDAVADWMEDFDTPKVSLQNPELPRRGREL